MSPPDPLQAHLAKWRLTPDGAPFETHSSWLAPVRHGTAPALLKRYKPHSDEMRSAEILRHWSGPAARVYEADDAAQLIERAMPGTPLSALVHDDDTATNIWCDTAAALHTKPAPDGWPDLFACGRKFQAPCPEHAALTRDLFEHGKREFFELCATQGPARFLLHRDLHHGNIIRDDARGWVVIDPKGNTGELEFEAASFLHNPTREFCEADHIARRVKIVSARLGLDADRLLRWCFAHGVLSALWATENSVFDPGGGVQAAHAALAVLGRKAV